MKVRYAVFIDDSETQVMPFDSVDIVEIDDDQVSDLYDLADENATLAQIEEALDVTAYTPPPVTPLAIKDEGLRRAVQAELDAIFPDDESDVRAHITKIEAILARTPEPPRETEGHVHSWVDGDCIVAGHQGPTEHGHIGKWCGPCVEYGLTSAAARSATPLEGPEQAAFGALLDAIYEHEARLTEKVGPNEAKRLAQPLYDFAWTTPLRASPETSREEERR